MVTKTKDKTEAKQFAGLAVDPDDMCLVSVGYHDYAVTHEFAALLFKTLNAAPVVARNYDADINGYKYTLERRYGSERGHSPVDIKPLHKNDLAQAVMAYNPED